MSRETDEAAAALELGERTCRDAARDLRKLSASMKDFAAAMEKATEDSKPGDLLATMARTHALNVRAWLVIVEAVAERLG